jgi:hypothetical protein
MRVEFFCGQQPETLKPLEILAKSLQADLGDTFTKRAATGACVSVNQTLVASRNTFNEYNLLLCPQSACPKSPCPSALTINAKPRANPIGCPAKSPCILTAWRELISNGVLGHFRSSEIADDGDFGGAEVDVSPCELGALCLLEASQPREFYEIPALLGRIGEFLRANAFQD